MIGEKRHDLGATEFVASADLGHASQRGEIGAGSVGSANPRERAGDDEQPAPIFKIRHHFDKRRDRRQTRNHTPTPTAPLAAALSRKNANKYRLIKTTKSLRSNIFSTNGCVVKPTQHEATAGINRAGSGLTSSRLVTDVVALHKAAS
jgi:hypothetical protein